MVKRNERKNLAEQLLEQFAPGDVFSSFDLRDSGYKSASVRSTFSRMVKKGKLLRLSDGFYAVPRISRFSGRVLYPSSDCVAKAVGRRCGSKIMPSGACLANKYCLSEQVPARDEYLVDAPNRRIRSGNAWIVFTRASKETLQQADTLLGELMVALQYLSTPWNRTQDVRARLSQTLSPKSKQELSLCAASAPAWMQPLIADLP